MGTSGSNWRVDSDQHLVPKAMLSPDVSSAPIPELRKTIAVPFECKIQGTAPIIDILLPQNTELASARLQRLSCEQPTPSGFRAQNLIIWDLTFPDQGDGRGTVEHPFHVHENGAPMRVTGNAGEKMVVIEMPFFRSPPKDIGIEIDMSIDAREGQANDSHFIRSRCGFRFPESATGFGEFIRTYQLDLEGFEDAPEGGHRAVPAETSSIAELTGAVSSEVIAVNGESINTVDPRFVTRIHIGDLVSQRVTYQTPFCDTASLTERDFETTVGAAENAKLATEDIENVRLVPREATIRLSPGSRRRTGVRAELPLGAGLVSGSIHAHADPAILTTRKSIQDAAQEPIQNHDSSITFDLGTLTNTDPAHEKLVVIRFLVAVRESASDPQICRRNAYDAVNFNDPILIGVGLSDDLPEPEFAHVTESSDSEYTAHSTSSADGRVTITFNAVAQTSAPPRPSIHDVALVSDERANQSEIRFRNGGSTQVSRVRAIHLMPKTQELDLSSVGVRTHGVVRGIVIQQDVNNRVDVCFESMAPGATVCIQFSASESRNNRCAASQIPGPGTLGQILPNRIAA